MKYPKELIFKTKGGELIVNLNDVNYMPSLNKFRATIFISNPFVNAECNDDFEVKTEEKEF